MFGYCEALVDATLEEGITVIAPNLFNRCIALKKVMLPSTVTTIGTSIFFNDYSMEILIVKSVTPPTVDGNDLGYNFSKQCKIYVPDINKIAGGHSILVEYTLCLHITNKIIRCFFVLK